jgi:hypothetical protein
MICLHFTKVSILHRQHGSDIVDLQTELPGPIGPISEKLSLRFNVVKDGGLEYVKRHFPGVPITETWDRERPVPRPNPAGPGEG